MISYELVSFILHTLTAETEPESQNPLNLITEINNSTNRHI